jgi:uncharacterized membrane protein YbhN (UPF0104 family)
LKNLFKSIKNKRFISPFVKIFLFALVVLFFFFQLKKLNFNTLLLISVKNYYFLFFAFLLLFLNWFLEFLKWASLLKLLTIQTKLETQLKSFLAGILTGFLSPNLIGNFIGRLNYFEKKHRISIIYHTQFSNAAQFFSSIIFGLIAVIIIGFPKESYINQSLFTTILLSSFIFLCVLLFFNLNKLFQIFFKSRKWFKRVNTSKNNYLFEFKQLILSSLRHAVFSLQYFLILTAFGLEIKIELFFFIWQIYFCSTLIPSFWFGKLLIRESMAIWILGVYTSQIESVLISSLILWFINQGLPALFGLPYLRITKNQN